MLEDAFKKKKPFKSGYFQTVGAKDIMRSACFTLKERSHRHVIKIAFGDMPIIKPKRKFMIDPTLTGIKNVTCLARFALKSRSDKHIIRIWYSYQLRESTGGISLFLSQD